MSVMPVITFKQHFKMQVPKRRNKHVYVIKFEGMQGMKSKNLCQEDVWGCGCIDPHFLDLDTNWRCGQFHAPAALPLRKQLLVSIG
jgi:hypothetical protein